MFEQTFEDENPRPKTRYKRRVTTSFKVDMTVFYAPVSKDWEAYCFTIVRLSVRMSVCTNLT